MNLNALKKLMHLKLFKNKKTILKLKPRTDLEFKNYLINQEG